MASKSGLLGPFPLTEEMIGGKIERLSIGAYAAGTASKKGFVIERIGRSDRDLAGELRKLIGTYKYFRFRTYVSTRRAYAKECELFHAFKPKDTKAHPAPPKGVNVACPVMGCEHAD